MKNQTFIVFDELLLTTQILRNSTFPIGGFDAVLSQEFDLANQGYHRSVA